MSTPKNITSTTVLSYNIQGIQNKLEYLAKIQKTKKINIICLQETWATNNYNIPLLNTIAKSTTEAPTIIQNGRRTKGGLAILADNNTAVRCKTIKEAVNFLHIKLDDINLINCYIPPSADDNILLNIFDYTQSLQGRIVLFGDLNCRLGYISNDNIIDKRGHLCLNNITDYNLTVETPIEGRWTSISIHGRGIPDHLLTNGANIANYKVLPTTISDHYPLIFDVCINRQVDSDLYRRWNVRLFTDLEVRANYSRLIADSCAKTDLKKFEKKKLKHNGNS